MEKEKKDALKQRCDKLIKQNAPRRVQHFSSKAMYSMLQDLGKIKTAPLIRMDGYRANRGYGLMRVFKQYLKFLIEESLEYPISIYIPYVGILKIKEVDSIGKRRYWTDHKGEFKYRFDTPFDKSVMYRVYHTIFGLENVNFQTPFRLNSKFASEILRQVYIKHPEGGYYPKYIKKKK